MMNRESKAKKNIALALETLFLALVGVYLVYRLSRSTTFHLSWPSRFESRIMYALAAVALAHLLALGPLRREALAAAAMALVYGAVYRASGYTFLLLLAIFTIGFIGVDYRKIFKMYLLTVGVFYAVTMLAGLMGVITNYVTTRSGRGVRSAWGMSYYTDFAALGLFLLMSLWVIWRKLPDWAMLLLCAGYMCMSGFIAHSNTSTFCAGLLTCAVLYCGFEQRFVRSRSGLRWMEKGPGLFATFGFPLLALCMFGLMLAYARGMGVGYRLNTMLSNRLQRGVAAWQSYGLKPFGTPFQQYGNGFSTFPSNRYNFVDSTYPLVLVRYGWVTFLMLCLSWGWTALQVRRSGDRRLLLVMGIIAVHAFSEHHFIDSHFNLLVTMPFAAFVPATDAAIEPRREGRATTLAWTITALLLGLAAFLAGPAVLSRLKTALELLRYGHGEHALRLVVVLCGALGIIALAAWAVSALVRSLLLRARVGRRAVIALALVALLGIGAWLYTGRVIGNAADQYAATLASDREALEIAVHAATGRVYSGVLPALYGREIDGLSYAACFEDDLARLRGDTVLMPADAERGPFIDNGFLYVPVSGEHALYTGDRAVVEALSEAGYRATGYYSGVQSVDLADAAALNGLAYAPDAGLRLTAGGEGMRQGPWQDIYGGQYTATWELRLPEDSGAQSGKVCTLAVTAFKGDEVVLEKEITADRFEGGRLRVSVPFKIADSRNVAFEAWTDGGATVDILGIEYARTPTYDVHTYYDGRLRKIRDEYYDADGAPILRKEGWFACDYGYDRYGNIASLRYYDREGQLTVIRAGYAERRRTYNEKKQVVREAYYGEDGAMIIGADGYAAFEREYDAAGNAVVERYFDTDGDPLVISDGYAEVRRTYDADKQVVREAYYGPDGAPAILPEGHSGVALGYDGAGNVNLRSFLDADGEPMMIDDGYAQVSRTFDGQHQVILEAYLDLAGDAVLCAGGYAANAREYDEAGNACVQRYYGTDGQLVVISTGYAAVERDFNALRQVVRERYYGADERPVALAYGQYGLELGYDDMGNRAVYRYLDAQGRLMMNTEGYAESHREYNKRRQLVREDFYDLEGRPVMTVKGYASVERIYDENGKLASKRFYDADGNLIGE